MTDQSNRVLQPVSAAEAGQKLLQFLERRFALPPTMLHRWIRTGQIRCNGKRCKPFQHVAEGDAVRLPPFALRLPPSAGPQNAPSAPLLKRVPDRAAERPLLPLPPLVYESPDLFVFNKIAGLPVHPGTGHSDSLTTRLHAVADGLFCPTPAHRLDKDTSGLLLVARSYTRLRALQEAFAVRGLVKEYLAWVEGSWQEGPAQLLRDCLSKQYTGTHEKVEVYKAKTGARAAEDKGHEAACLVSCLHRDNVNRVNRVNGEMAKMGGHQPRSLMHIRLLTGKTHQIRVQLASRGHPLCGDVKYGSRQRPPFKLHAMRLILQDGTCFEALPPWQGNWEVLQLPPPLALPVLVPARFAL